MSESKSSDKERKKGCTFKTATKKKMSGESTIQRRSTKKGAAFLSL